jgi:formamidopyrimidine-DNA glycosylase
MADGRAEASRGGTPGRLAQPPMPELPDVEAARRFLVRWAEGRRIDRVVVTDPSILRNASPREVEAALRGRYFGPPERLGKWLLAWTDGPCLILHFGMTGDLRSSEEEPARHRWDRIIIELDDGTEIRYRNMRKLGGAWLALGHDDVAAILGRVGPDALSIGRTQFLRRLLRRRGGVKAALLDQGFVAGVGNLLADETLWRARIHPRRLIETLTDDERVALFRAMHGVVKTSVDRYGSIARKRTWLNHVRACPVPSALGAARPSSGSTPVDERPGSVRRVSSRPHSAAPDGVTSPRAGRRSGPGATPDRRSMPLPRSAPSPRSIGVAGSDRTRSRSRHPRSAL